LIDKGLEFVPIFSGDEIWVEDNLHAAVLHPSRGDAMRFEARSDINNSSLILMIKFGSNRILLTGDLESEGWKKILGRQLDIKAQILKFPHHGAWKDLGDPNDENGLGRRIINAIEPEIIIFSVGTNNINHHPKADSMLAVRKHNHQTRIICTQGTTSCVQNHFPARKQISAMLYDECRIGNEFGSEVPCAGTIIVRFDEKSYWVEPTIAVHDEAISLYQAPMCRVDLQKLNTLVTLQKSSF
jgi:competence protein ComEC